VVREYEVKGATSSPEIDAALIELEERVVSLDETLTKEVAEATKKHDEEDALKT
jgi:hypothetical protein